MDKAKTEWLQALTIDNNNVEALDAVESARAAGGSNIPDAIGYLKALDRTSNPIPAPLRCSVRRIPIVRDYAGSKDACSKSFQLARSPQTLGCIAGADFELKNYKEAAQIFDVLDNNAKRLSRSESRSCCSSPARAISSSTSARKRSNAYRRLLPMVKKGTKQYSEIQGWIADLSKPSHRAGEEEAAAH